MYNREEFKAEARRLRAHLATRHGLELSIGHALEAIAVVHNYPNWDAASAAARDGEPDHPAEHIEAVRPYKEAQIIVADAIPTEEVYRQVCFVIRCNPDHFAFLVEENDARPGADWDRITDVITQSGLSYSRTYVSTGYLAPSI